MTVDPIDFQGIMAELDGYESEWTGLPEGTMMGHIHLQVAQIPTSEQFYIDLLGFDLVTRYSPAASFLSANGYHHHFGMNTWAGAGLAPAPPTAARLLWYEIILPDHDSITTISNRLGAAGYPHEPGEDYVNVTDPSGIAIHLTAG